MDTPHLLFPLTFNQAGGFATVEQGSPAEVESRASVTLRCPQGWLDEPFAEFGLPELDFDTDSPVETVRETLRTWVPDLGEAATARIAEDHVTHLITVGQRNAR